MVGLPSKNFQEESGRLCTKLWYCDPFSFRCYGLPVPKAPGLLGLQASKLRSAQTICCSATATLLHCYRG